MEKRQTWPSNVFKFCPRCGHKEFLFDGNRSFKCSECSFHFFVNSSAAVAAIIVDQQGRILFTIRAHDPMKGYLDLPGGFVDPLESAETALVREIKEELGLIVKSWRYIGSYPNEYPFGGLTVFTTDLGFYTQVESFEGILAADDIVGYEFIHPSEIDYSRICSNSMASLIKNFLIQKL